MMKGVKISSFSVLLIFAVLVTIGAALIPALNLQYMPRSKQQSLSIYYYWQNASARVMESEVTSRIEGYVSSVKDIETIASMSRKGSGSITMYLKKNADMDAVRFEVSSAIRSLYDKLPEGVTYPELSVSATGKDINPVIMFTINADLPTNRIEQYVNDHIIKDLAIIEGVHSVSLSGATPDYTEISLNTEKIKSAGINTSDIYNAVASYLGDRTVIGTAPAQDRSDEPDIVVRNVRTDFRHLPVANAEGRIIRHHQYQRLS